MRVLQLVTRRQLRGAEVFAARLSEGLVRRGVEVWFAGLYPPGETPLTPEGAIVGDLSPTATAWAAPLRIARLATTIRRVRPHVIQANGSATLKYSVAATRLPFCHCPLVYRNISVASHWVGSRWKRAAYRRLFRTVNRVVSVSEESRNDLLATYGYPADRASVIYRGVEVPDRVDRPAARRRLAKAAGADPGRPLLLHVGSLTPEKNHTGILHAFASLLETAPDAHLCFAGRGPLEVELRHRVGELGLSSRVTFLGLRRDAPELTAGADLLVLFSDVEGVPGVALEAGARGTPAVASRVGGVPEAVIDGETGILIEPGNVRGLVETISELLAAPDRLDALGRGARARVMAFFDLERAVDQFLELYGELCDEQSDRN